MEGNNSIYGLVLTGLTVTIAWHLQKRFLATRKLTMPYLEFEGDDSKQRYITDTQSLMNIGYKKHLKYGQAFAMRNPIDDARPQVILPLKYLEEVRSAPQERLSFPLFSQEAFSLTHTGGPPQTDEAAHMVRLDLNRALNSLIKYMEEECNLGFEKMMPPCSDWTPILPYQIFAYLVARVTARALVGPELCHNDEWIGLSIEMTITIIAAATSLRDTWPLSLRWLAKWFHPETKKVISNRRKAAELLRPILEARVAATKEGRASKYADGVQWLLEGYRVQKKTLTAEKLAQDQLFLSIASIHSSSATALSTLYDLIDHPECLAEIREEIQQVYREHGEWTRKTLGLLRKMDSFMKESQRLHTLGQVTVQRAAVRPWAFKDGLHIPAGVQISFPSQQLNLDPDIHGNADQFDPWRYLRKRQTIDPNRFHFASVSDDSINFGAGFHACPGRFFSTEELKLIFVYLLNHYEFKFADPGQHRPPEMAHDFANTPNVATPVLFKRVS